MKRAALGALVTLALALTQAACGKQGAPAPTPNLEATVQAQVQATVTTAMAAPATGTTASNQLAVDVRPAVSTALPSPTAQHEEPTAAATSTTAAITERATPNPTVAAFVKQLQPVGLLVMLDDYRGYQLGAQAALAGLWEGRDINKGLDSVLKLGLLTRAQEGRNYAPGQALLVGDSLMVGVAGYRLDADQLSLSQGQGYLVVDFAIMNFSQDSYLSLDSMFELADTAMFTYSPTFFARTAGDIQGRIAPHGLRRAEVAFAIPATIPPNRRRFLLRLNPGIAPAEEVTFSIDTNAAPPQLPAMPIQTAPTQASPATQPIQPTLTPIPTSAPAAPASTSTPSPASSAAPPPVQPAAAAAPPTIPHPLTGRQDCTSCHQVGSAGIGVNGGTGMGPSHQSFTNARCQACHKPT